MLKRKYDPFGLIMLWVTSNIAMLIGARNLFGAHAVISELGQRQIDMGLIFLGMGVIGSLCLLYFLLERNKVAAEMDLKYSDA